MKIIIFLLLIDNSETGAFYKKDLLIKLKKNTTSPYHPQTNAQVEVCNKSKNNTATKENMDKKI